MPLSDKISEIGPALETYLVGRKADLGVSDIWYSVDGGMPRTPAILIDPQGKARQLQETGFTTLNTINFNLTLLHSRLDNQSVTAKECVDLAEQLEDVLHEDRRLGGLVIHSYVGRIETGLATRQRATMRAARLLWTATTKTRL